MLDYRTHIAEGSMFNTPPVLPIYTIMETLRWIKGLGGVKVIQEMNRKKAQLLYDAIDNSKIFTGTVNREDRSLMNICFVMKEQYKDKEDAFMEVAKKNGMIGIKGHRSVGGIRASVYNAFPLEGARALAQSDLDGGETRLRGIPAIVRVRRNCIRSGLELPDHHGAFAQV